MKSILFVDKSFAVGGIQTSMINMINTLSEKYEISLFVYNPEGPLKERLSKNVKLIKPSWRVNTLGMSFKDCLKNGSIKQKLFRIIMTAWAKVLDNRIPLKCAFKYQPVLKSYDYAIAYHHETERTSLTSGFARFIKQCVVADKYISWIHNDANNNPIDESFNDKYYCELDEIVCVSEAVKNSFLDKHNSIPEERVKVCHNFLDFNSIDNMAENEPQIKFDKNKFCCFSACRLETVKGFPRAIKAMADTIMKYDVQWYIAGSGSEKETIEKTILECGLENNIYLLGMVSNPYPLIMQADLLVLCSYFEAAPMLYSEAKYFRKPVFTTETSSSSEMLDGGKYGLICENSSDGIEKGFRLLFENKNILECINENLKKSNYRKEGLIEIFESIV